MTDLFQRLWGHFFGPKVSLVLAYLTDAVAILVFILLTVMFLIWLERKVAARFQNRLGPMRVGRPHGWLQSVADVLKLLLKEDVIPTKADRWVFTLAPIVVVVPAILIWVCIPFSRNLVAKDLNIGIFYIISLASLGVLGIIMGGWAANNKYTLIGGLRSAAQMISYEIPLVLSVVAVVVLAGTMDMNGLVARQAPYRWFVFWVPVGPLAFLIYLTAAVAETNRVPFDLPEAESELVSGFHTEYSGMKFGFFFLAEFTNMFAVSAIATTLFLGGWLGPGNLGPLWFLIKTYAIVFFIMWLRWTLPRVRGDQLMKLAWKVLLPSSLVVLFLASVMVAVGFGGARG